MDREHNQWGYYNYVNTGSTYSFFTRDRKIEVPEEVLKKKQVYDSLQNIKLQQEYQARNDSMARVAAATPATSNPDTTRDAITESAPAAVAPDGDSESTDTPAEAPLALNTEIDTLKDNTKEVLKDTLRDKMLNSLSQNKATAAAAAPVTELVLSPEQSARLDSIINEREFQSRAASIALNTARTLKNNFSNNFTRLDGFERESRRWEIAWYQKYTQAFACIVMFMIGAPLGAIIKKGGLGMPVLISIIFFIIYYMLTITGEKWAKEGVTDPLIGTIFSVTALLPFGIFFRAIYSHSVRSPAI